MTSAIAFLTPILKRLSADTFCLADALKSYSRLLIWLENRHPRGGRKTAVLRTLDPFLYNLVLTRPPKVTHGLRQVSSDVFIVKIGWPFRAGRRAEKQTRKKFDHLFHPFDEPTPYNKFGMVGALVDLINYAKFCVGIFKGFRLNGGTILAFPIGLSAASHLYNCASIIVQHVVICW